MALTRAGAMAAIEAAIYTDPALRGIQNCFVPGAVGAAGEALSKASSVLVTTGFFIPAVDAGENDGPVGSAALARALVGAGKSVVVVTDDPNATVVDAALSAAVEEEGKVSLEIFPEVDGEVSSFLERIKEEYNPDVMVAIERPGRTEDGRYRNMGGVDISGHTRPIDEMFLPSGAFLTDGMVSIGVGDGGNEIGMGHADVEEAIKRDVNDGELVRTVVGTDVLIATGVSNWGGYALAASLAVILDQPHLAMTSALDKEVMLAVNAVGGVDGVRKRVGMSVDDLDWEDCHKVLIDDIAGVVAAAAAAAAAPRSTA